VECLPSSQKAFPPLFKLYLIVLLSCDIIPHRSTVNKPDVTILHASVPERR
jgi:hypothetical protein